MEFKMTANGFNTETSFGTLTISADDSYGFRPYQLLVSSIAVCSGGVLRKILEKMRIPAENISIQVKEVVRNPDEANKVEKIHLHFIIEGEKVVEEKVSKAMELTKNNCAMVQSVIDSIIIEETYEVIN
ncbi:OsmC family protein [Sporosarcina sp. G11-34]|uniref:OsmC family protein n=1 Tax=Sporosarcina sp. G11-34 TaxID=2849605 RepID=UPI0022A974C4|nr:OsmC family protein [Sporosarcina sp. G11-34]MCZ2260237.1 OsmC family protein [Sporosarcina sp. G11-34]